MYTLYLLHSINQSRSQSSPDSKMGKSTSSLNDSSCKVVLQRRSIERGRKYYADVCILFLVGIIIMPILQREKQKHKFVK